MNYTRRLPLSIFSSLMLLAACGDSSPEPADESSETSAGDGDGDSGDGDGDSGDGDGDSGDGDGDEEPYDPNLDIPPPDADGCHAIYAQDVFPEFTLVVQQSVWEQLQYNWNNGEALEADPELDPREYYPLQEFRYQHPGYEEIVIYDAEIRLRGNEINWNPIPEDKMQFQIGFHRNDPEEGRFLGLKRILFDAATFNRHMLRDRLSLQVMRDAGIKATCANNARVMVDVEYPNPADEAELGEPFFYGVFTNLEKLDEVYLERAWEDPTGDLWKRANWDLQTNEDTSNNDRLQAMRDANTVEELYEYLTLEQSLYVSAAEAVLCQGDGMWAGGLNYYFYDDPATGKFMMLPWDLDNGMDRFDNEPGDPYAYNPDPIVWEKPNSWGRPWYDMPLEQEMWFDFYIEQVRQVYEVAYDVDLLHTRIDDWTDQIRDSVYEDIYKPYPNSTYDNKVEDLHEHVQLRHEYMIEWLACWDNGGTPDAEGYCVP